MSHRTKTFELAITGNLKTRGLPIQTSLLRMHFVEKINGKTGLTFSLEDELDY